jgi:5-oxoprolinase (ATP-hydrolysing)
MLGVPPGVPLQLPGNFNAPCWSVALAAVLYVFRTLVDSDIPRNAGCRGPLRVTIPPGTMLSPSYPAAVAAGNAETSQAVTGALYAALGVQAEGAGTMNNVTFGNDARVPVAPGLSRSDRPCAAAGGGNVMYPGLLHL